MFKQTIWSIIAIFITWSMLDFLIHSVLLQSTYQDTAFLWRAEQDMKMALMSFVTLIFSIGFVSIYSHLVNPKSLLTGIQYGVIFGITAGISMGIGSYCYMPIPIGLAFSWFIASIVELSLAGVIVGYMVTDTDANS